LTNPWPRCILDIHQEEKGTKIMAKMTNQKAFELVDNFLNKEATASGNQGSHSFMLGYAESMLARLLVGSVYENDPTDDLIKRITDNQ
jgi:hypothetical protein